LLDWLKFMSNPPKLPKSIEKLVGYGFWGTPVKATLKLFSVRLRTGDSSFLAFGGGFILFWGGPIIFLIYIGPDAPPTNFSFFPSVDGLVWSVGVLVGSLGELTGYFFYYFSGILTVGGGASNERGLSLAKLRSKGW
jgi:hypothetical protein